MFKVKSTHVLAALLLAACSGCVRQAPVRHEPARPPAAAPLEIHLRTAAADGDGSAARPFGTPAEAAAQLRLRTPQERALPVRILLHGGVYAVTRPVAIGAAESGTPDAPVTWLAAGDGPVVISGGIPVPPAALHTVTDPQTLARLPQPQPAGCRLFELRLSDLGQSAFPPLLPHGMCTGLAAAWPALFCDGAPLPLAAWPDTPGYSKGFKPTKILSAGTTAEVIAGGASATENKAGSDAMVFAFKNDRAARWKTALDSFKAELWIGGHWYWDWADDLLPVKSIGAGGVITIGKPHHYGLGPHASFHLFNLAEEIDQPGEYAVEPANRRILVLLGPGQEGRGLILSWSGAPLVAMDHASHTRFEGITFAHGRADGAALTACSGIGFDRCTFTALGRNGVTAGGDRITVADCRFSRLGGCGVDISGGDRASLTPANHRIARCEFRDFSRLKRTYAPGVNLNGVGTTVENCLFFNAPHTAILFGGNEHRIRNNEIHTVLTETGDCGAIYGGRDWTTFGTVISGNWIHDLGGNPGRWPCAIYLDDMLSGITVENNLIERTALGVLVGGGRHNTVTRNIIIGCDEALHLDSRAAGWAGKMLPLMKERLAAMPTAAEPWISRYPMLAKTLQEQPEKPVGTRITGNVAVGCKKMWHSKEPSQVATVEPNQEVRSVEEAPFRLERPQVGPRSDDTSRPPLSI